MCDGNSAWQRILHFFATFYTNLAEKILPTFWVYAYFFFAALLLERGEVYG